ncbi:hypothetical protein KO537_19280 [Shewanella sp. NKUCC01_JLK]|uniref:hypothetical protein n=1 Tax=Shewanella sp. NKUCC01_JLK TaxID=2842123 RepID=UPI001C5AD8E3|nr:hypothetical protein [Shewanella sp. NKUCC01_JLK]MBW3516833.1 hypothetical protein [Shewanella sp. NKUCC01_JLK]
MDDDLDFDFEEFEREFERECEQHEKEMDTLNAQLDNAFEWMDLLFDLQSSIERFNENMNSLNLGIESQKKESEPNCFLYGTLLIGIISAYEGFIHELFNACCNKTDYIKDALLNIKKLTSEDARHLKISTKKTLSEGELKQKLLSATLHDPIQISRLSERLFGLKMPTIKNDFSKKLLELRNAFTHNNGYLGGEYVKPSYHDAKTVHHLFVALVNGYVNSITKNADVDLESMK